MSLCPFSLLPPRKSRRKQPAKRRRREQPQHPIQVRRIRREQSEQRHACPERRSSKQRQRLCRGNYHSTFFTSGPYDTVADYVFAKENVDALFLEYDDERSGGFAPLKKVSEDKKVVLGLITTKKPDLEDKEKVINRIKQATKYIPLERLCLSPQCGFASCAIGNKLTEEEQWAKLKLVKEIAEEVWGE